MAGMELLAFLSTMLFMDACSCQSILSIRQMLGGISSISVGFTPLSYFWLRLALALVFVYTAEICPTAIRNSAVRICSTVARIGCSICPDHCPPRLQLSIAAFPDHGRCTGRDKGFKNSQ